MHVSFIRGLLIACFLLLLTSCAHEQLQAYRVPGVDLNKIRSFHVIKIHGDAFNIDRMIADQLNKMGYKATYGPLSKPPEIVDAIVTYDDRWMWDMTMYLLKLSIRVHDGTTDLLMAKGESHRTSLVRKSPEEMVEEVLLEIFQKAPKISGNN